MWVGGEGRVGERDRERETEIRNMHYEHTNSKIIL